MPRASSTTTRSQPTTFNATSGNSNLQLIGFVRAWLDACGVPYRLSTGPDGRKANLHALIGPSTPGGIALSDHVDTVPIGRHACTSHPFTRREVGGRLYGRGATDMKSFAACCLAAVPALMARPLTVSAPYACSSHMTKRPI